MFRLLVLLLVSTAPASANISPLSSAFYSTFSGNLGSECQKHFDQYISDLSQKKYWATSMFDATGKLQPGILSGNMVSLGFFDQCLDVSKYTYAGQINGKYCLGSVSLGIEMDVDDLDPLESHQSLDVSWGVCVPHSCQADDLVPIFQNLITGVVDASNVTVHFDQNLCQTYADVHPKLSAGAIVTIAIIGTIIMIVIPCTIIDLYEKRSSSKNLVRIVKSFSAISNGMAIFSSSQNQEHMLCLNGLKAISLFWIILLHEYSIFASGPVENSKDFQMWNDSVLSGYERSGHLAVETFFVIGGLLVSYNYLKKAEAGKPFNIFQFYLHRIIRILPALAGVVLVSATSLRYFGSGPYWHYLVDSFQASCEENWWSTILFVQNYVNVDRMCVGHAWYLAVDMQLFLLSPLILLPLRKHKRTVVSFTILLIIALIGGGFATAWFMELDAMSNDYNATQKLNNNYYLLTHTRAPSWLIGLLCGVFIQQFKHKPFKIPNIPAVCLWILSLAALLTCTFGGYATLQNAEYRRLDHALYIALTRPAFSLALCWVIIGCVFGCGGIINELLSLSVLQYFSKLTYSMYLIHVTMMYVFVFSSKTPSRFSNLFLMQKFWGDCFFSLFLALILVLTVEFPFIGLEKFINR